MLSHHWIPDQSEDLSQILNQETQKNYCVKSIRIQSFYGPYFLAFGRNTERYRVSLSIQSKCGK